MKKAILIASALICVSIAVSAQSVTTPEVRQADNSSCEITKIEVTDKFTIISFEHTGGRANTWVTINNTMYVQSSTDDSRYSFVKAEGIPIKPENHYYKQDNEKLAFKVYFQKLQPQVKSIDIIEKAGAPHYFNFYGVSLENSRRPIVRNVNPRESIVRADLNGDVSIDIARAVMPMYSKLMQTTMNAQLEYYSQPGKIAEIAKLNKLYFNELVKQGFTQDQALKIITVTPIAPKIPGGDK